MSGFPEIRDCGCGYSASELIATERPVPGWQMHCGGCGIRGSWSPANIFAIEQWNTMQLALSRPAPTLDRSLLAAHALDRVEARLSTEEINSAQYIGVVVLLDNGSVLSSEGWDQGDNASFSAWAAYGAAAHLARKVADRWLPTGSSEE